MRPVGRHRRKHFGRVMDLVEFPQERHVVQQAVHDEAAEVVRDEEGEGEQYPDKSGRFGAGRGRYQLFFTLPIQGYDPLHQ